MIVGLACSWPTWTVIISTRIPARPGSLLATALARSACSAPDLLCREHHHGDLLYRQLRLLSEPQQDVVERLDPGRERWGKLGPGVAVYAGRCAHARWRGDPSAADLLGDFDESEDPPASAGVQIVHFDARRLTNEEPNIMTVTK